MSWKIYENVDLGEIYVCDQEILGQKLKITKISLKYLKKHNKIMQIWQKNRKFKKFYKKFNLSPIDLWMISTRIWNSFCFSGRLLWVSMNFPISNEAMSNISWLRSRVIWRLEEPSSQSGDMGRDLYRWKAEKTLIPNIYSVFALEAWYSRKTRSKFRPLASHYLPDVLTISTAW